MNDTKNLITRLDDMRMFADLEIHPIVSPEHWNIYSELCDLIDLAAEAAEELLKEQEMQDSVKPHRNYQYFSDYWCECGWHLGKARSVKYCSKCGRAVKWDD